MRWHAVNNMIEEFCKLLAVLQRELIDRADDI